MNWALEDARSSLEAMASATKDTPVPYVIEGTAVPDVLARDQLIGAIGLAVLDLYEGMIELKGDIYAGR